MEIVIAIGLLFLGFMLGFLAKALLDYSFQEYDGTIVAKRDERRDKLVYSLILDEDPDQLEFKKTVVFKVITNEQSQAKHVL